MSKRVCSIVVIVLLLLILYTYNTADLAGSHEHDINPNRDSETADSRGDISSVYILTIIVIIAFTIPDTSEIEVWEEEDIEEDLQLEDENCMTDEGPAITNSSHSLVLWLVHFLALLKKRCGLPSVALALRCLSIFFAILGRLSPQLAGISQYFPPTVYKLHKLLGTQKETFERYVTCQKCSSVYIYSDCTDKIGSRVVPKLCVHRDSNYTIPCNGTLLRSVELVNSNNSLPNFSILLHAMQGITDASGQTWIS